MRNLIKILLTTGFLLGFLIASDVLAEGWLNKQEAHELVSGNTVKGFYMKQKESLLTGRVNLILKFRKDGSAEKTTIRPKDGNFTETGKWFVNKKGRLCMIWDRENKKKCGRLRRAFDGAYELVRKKQKFVYEEIIPGT